MVVSDAFLGERELGLQEIEDLTGNNYSFVRPAVMTFGPFENHRVSMKPILNHLHDLFISHAKERYGRGLLNSISN